MWGGTSRHLVGREGMDRGRMGGEDKGEDGLDNGDEDLAFGMAP